MKVLVSGNPGVGKTTLIQKVCSRLKGVAVSGFYTLEIREGARRVGFKIVTLDGREGVLAHVDFVGPHRVGRYGVDLRALAELAVPRIRPEMVAADLIVIDEIGKMECLSERFRRAVLAALAAPVPVLATIGKGGNEFIRGIGRRTDVELKEITPENRDALAEELALRLGQALGRRAI